MHHINILPLLFLPGVVDLFSQTTLVPELFFLCESLLLLYKSVFNIRIPNNKKVAKPMF